MPDLTPLQKASFALDEWRDEFNDEWRDVAVDPSEPWPEQEEKRRQNEIVGFFRPFHNRTTALLKTILEQRVADSLVPEIEALPFAEYAGSSDFDLRLARFLPEEATWLFDCLDADFLEQVIQGIRESVSVQTGTRRQVYILLLVSALQGPASPIASWYLQRATRLLLLGLHPECIAMCRAVLAAALRFRFDDAELERVHTIKHGGTREHPDYSLSDLCWGASRLIRDPPIWDVARMIRVDGNSVLHPETPERFERVSNAPDATKYVVGLCRILRALFPAAGA